MRAAFYTEQGKARAVFKTGDLPDPTPGSGEVRVRIHASGVNPTDTYTRSGARGQGMPFERIVPHQDGAGLIDEVGEGVSRARIGERVWLYMAQWQRPFGTAAQYCVLPKERAVRLPDNCSFNEGACLGVPWLTAHYAVTLEGSVEGQTLLVAGGTGAVGFYAVQLAKAKGARVIATVGSEEKGKAAKAAGADEVVNFRAGDAGERVAQLTQGRGVDRILEPHFVSNARLYPKMLRKRGTVVVYGSGGPEATLSASWCIQNQPVIRFIYLYEVPPEAYANGIADFERMQTAGQLKHLPVREFPLERTGEAHEAVEKGNSGTRMVIKLP